MAKLKFVVEFAVDETWIADGFNLTSEQAKEMLATSLCHAYGHELSAKVTKRPDQRRVAKLQGFKSVAAMNKADRQ